MKKIIGAAFAATTTFFATAALAVPVTWYLGNLTSSGSVEEGIRFDDGGIATGSFVLDEDTGKIVEANITTSAGSSMGGETYTDIGRYSGHDSFYDASADILYEWTAVDLRTEPEPSASSDLIGADYLYFWLEGYLTSASDIYNVYGHWSVSLGTDGWVEGTCGDTICDDLDPTRSARRFEAGSTPVFTSYNPALVLAASDPAPVPLPAGFGLMLTAMAAFGVARLRRKA